MVTFIAAELVTQQGPATVAPLDAVWHPHVVSRSALTRESYRVASERGPRDFWTQSSLPRGVAQRNSIQPVSLTSGAAGAADGLASGATGSAGTGLIPYETFSTYPLTTDTTAQVDLGNGNLILKSTAVSLKSPGVPLNDDRYFNSLQTYAGSFGGRWNSVLSGFDVGLSFGATNTYFVAPGGALEKFAPDGNGGWTPPPSLDATLVKGSSSSTLTYNQTGEVLTFNAAGWLTSDVNNSGVGSTYTYDSSGRVTKVTEASGLYFTVTWGTSNGANVITAVADSAGRTTTYQHDSSGRLSEVDSPGSYWEKYLYDTNGRVSEIQAVGPTTSQQDVSDFGYDSTGRVTSISQGVLGASTPMRTTTFSGWGASSTLTVTDGSDRVTQWGINAYNIPISQTDGNGNKTSWTHNANGDVTSITYPNSTSPQALAYNSGNSNVTSAAPTGATVKTTYGSSGSCAGSGAGAYDAHCITDASGTTAAFSYDANGNMTSSSITGPTGTSIPSTTYTYATTTNGCGAQASQAFAGAVCSMTDGNNHTTHYQYDSHGNTTAYIPPSPQNQTSYGYDSLGRMTSVTDGNGLTTNFTYNVRDQVVTTSYSGGTVLTNTWTPNGLKSNASEDSANYDTFTYDALSELTQEYRRHASRTVNETYTFDGAGNLTSYNDLYGTVAYAYDAASNLSQLVEPSGSCPTSGAPAAGSGCITFAYDSLNQEVLRTFPGGATVVTARDASERETRITATDASGTVRYDKGYSYSDGTQDTANVQTATSYVETGVPAGAKTAYAYDDAGRLGGVTEKTVSGSVNASWAYSYDAVGNRTKQVLTGAVGSATGAPVAGITTFTFDGANELTSTSADTSAWTYDSAGELTHNGLSNLSTSYNDRGGLTTAGSSTYAKFADGNNPTFNRINGSTKTSYTTSSQLGLIGEDFGSQRIYDRSPTGQAVGSRLGAGSRYYYIEDTLGSVVGLFDKNGAYVGGYTYGPYGEPRFMGGDVSLTNNHLRYVSGYFDETTNLYLLGDRYYDPQVAQFTQPDPIDAGNDTAYTYPNDPINGEDPTGEKYVDHVTWMKNVPGYGKHESLYIFLTAQGRLRPDPFDHILFATWKEIVHLAGKRANTSTMYYQFACHWLIYDVRALKPHIDIEPDRKLVAWPWGYVSTDIKKECNPAWK